MNSLIWFRNDLRIQNNLALKKAIESSDQLEAVYIMPNDNEWFIGEAAQWYLNQSLGILEKELKALGIRLNYYRNNASEILNKKITKENIEAIFCNQSSNPIQIKIDEDVLSHLPQNCQLNYVGRDTILDSETLHTKTGTYYKIYTPFLNKFNQVITQNKLEQQLCQITKKQYFNLSERTTYLQDLQLLPKNKWYLKFEKYWEPGENNAQKNIGQFIQNHLHEYDKLRDYVSEDATAKISAAINFGEISTADLYQTLDQVLLTSNASCELGIHTFMKQIIWREFAKYSLYHFPDAYLKSVYQYCDNEVLWNGDDILLELWKSSRTGIDIIDSAMHQLYEEGWMHNRSRMVVASFLTKNLGIHWLKGARWFWNNLVDGDLAINTMGWQWVAGTAPYSAQFNRIFNPIIQEQKYDIKNKYITKYLPSQPILNQPIVSISESSRAAKKRYIKIKQENY